MEMFEAFCNAYSFYLILSESVDIQQILFRSIKNNNKRTKKGKIAEETEIEGVCVNTAQIYVVKSTHRTY